MAGFTLAAASGFVSVPQTNLWRQFDMRGDHRRCLEVCKSGTLCRDTVGGVLTDSGRQPDQRCICVVLFTKCHMPLTFNV